MNIGPYILSALGWLFLHARAALRAAGERGKKPGAGLESTDLTD